MSRLSSPAEKPPRAWQRMLSGRRLDILAPSPLDIEITDIALGLSRVARWNGQTTGPHGYSVAQHSVEVAQMLLRRFPDLSHRAYLAGLLHDAPEYVTSDLITPFKRAIGAAYTTLEERMAEAVHLAFGLPARLPPAWEVAIKDCDRACAWLEAVSVAGFSEQDARQILGLRQTPPFVLLSPWSPDDARQRFLEMFERLR